MPGPGRPTVRRISLTSPLPPQYCELFYKVNKIHHSVLFRSDYERRSDSVFKKWIKGRSDLRRPGGPGHVVVWLRTAASGRTRGCRALKWAGPRLRRARGSRVQTMLLRVRALPGLPPRLCTHVTHLHGGCISSQGSRGRWRCWSELSFEQQRPRQLSSPEASAPACLSSAARTPLCVPGRSHVLRSSFGTFSLPAGAPRLLRASFSLSRYQLFFFLYLLTHPFLLSSKAI